jgi:hypothetical protein
MFVERISTLMPTLQNSKRKKINTRTFLFSAADGFAFNIPTLDLYSAEVTGEIALSPNVDYTFNCTVSPVTLWIDDHRGKKIIK